MKKTDENASDLDLVRQEIDQLDEQIQSLINDRARLAFRVRQSKNQGQSASAVDYYRPEREANHVGLPGSAGTPENSLPGA
jgi:chorismate mutase/prephenate dehydratase